MKIGFNGYNAVYNGHFATYGQTPPQPTQNGWYGRTFRSWQDVCTYINVDRPYGIEIPISYTLTTARRRWLLSDCCNQLTSWFCTDI